jgi:hypothetical protein
MKGFVKEMALNEFGHAVLCEALAVVDDTALLHKNVSPEVKVRAAGPGSAGGGAGGGAAWRRCCLAAGGVGGKPLLAPAAGTAYLHHGGGACRMLCLPRPGPTR